MILSTLDMDMKHLSNEWIYYLQELLKREGNKNRGGVSFIIVILIGLLGIIMGYLMKKA